MQRYVGQLAVGIGLWCAAGAIGGWAQTPAEAGRALFATKGCAHCHGEQAQGTDRGPDLRDMKPRPSKAHMHGQIVNGGDGMPPFGEVLQEAEVKQLIAYLRSLKPEKGGVKPTAPPTTAGQ